MMKRDCYKPRIQYLLNYLDYLVKEIKYSPASIRRDLTLLEKQGLVSRSYGGVAYKDENIERSEVGPFNEEPGSAE